jgi:hypothetical protein
MKFILVILTSFCALGLYGQRVFATNSWGSTILQFSKGKINTTADIGFRTTNHFIKQPRTSLFRIMVDYGKTQKHRLGIGSAYFEHYNLETIQELRFFVHYHFFKETRFNRFSIRMRDELRFFSTHTTLNRFRVQLSNQCNYFKTFNPYTSVEYFYTPKTQLIEQRYLLGMQSKLTKSSKLNTYYQLQYQSTIPYAQHIIGIQFLINL